MWSRLAYLQRWKTLLLWTGFAVLLALLPPLFQSDAYLLLIICTMGYYVILAMGMNLAMGYGGQFNLAIGGIFGVGAYATALSLLHGWSFPVALLISAGMGALVSTLIGLPSLRVRSHYLALVTLGLGQALTVIFINWDQVTHGDIGIFGIPPASLGPLVFSDNFQMSYLIMGMMFVMLGLASIFIRSRFGRNLMAVRDDHIAARTSGLNVGLYRLACFGMSGFYAGVAGSLYAVQVGYISPSTFTLGQSIFVLAQILIGGLGTLTGPLVGVVVLVSLREYLLQFGEWQYIIYGALIAFIVLVARGGVVGGIRAIWQRVPQRHPAKHLVLNANNVVVFSDLHDEKKVSNR
jgi:branched-chain amino acid transport system permease protein